MIQEGLYAIKQSNRNQHELTKQIRKLDKYYSVFTWHVHEKGI